MFLFLGWYYKLANVLWNIAGGPHTFPLPGQETLQVAQWSAWFRLGKWVGSRRVYIYIHIYCNSSNSDGSIILYTLWDVFVGGRGFIPHRLESYPIRKKHSGLPQPNQHLPQGGRVPNVLAQRNQKNTCWIMLVLFGDFMAVEFYPCHSVLHVCVAHMSSWMGIRYTQQPPVTLDNGPFLDDEAMVIFQ